MHQVVFSAHGSFAWCMVAGLIGIRLLPKHQTLFAQEHSGLHCENLTHSAAGGLSAAWLARS